MNNFWSFADKPSRPPIYRDCDSDTIYNYNRTFDICTIHDLLTRLPEFLDEEVAILPSFAYSISDALIASIITNEHQCGYRDVSGDHFVHVVYDGDEPQAVVWHGETINHQLIEADHKRYNLNSERSGEVQ